MTEIDAPDIEEGNIEEGKQVFCFKRPDQEAKGRKNLSGTLDASKVQDGYSIH